MIGGSRNGASESPVRAGIARGVVLGCPLRRGRGRFKPLRCGGGSGAGGTGSGNTALAAIPGRGFQPNWIAAAWQRVGGYVS